ncbi:PAS domain-containing protein [Halodesulfurarchaeum sp.]|uniref:PAS domain-containing protein n=1 Tax=Halodesulfurarchaeum sp. TaxID=1980530 RepID=UPI002FC2FBE4
MLSLISDEGNREQLADWIDAHDSFGSVSFEGDLEAVEFDVCILDGGALRRYETDLTSAKENAEPVLLPYLLFVPEFDRSSVTPDHDRLIDSITKSTVDEVVTLPINQDELEWRVESLLRLRNLSIQAYGQARRHQMLFESIRDAILVANTDRQIVECNQAFTDLFGYSLDEIAGKPTHAVYESKEEFEEMGKAIQGHIGDPEFTKIVSYERKSGEVFPGETNVFYLRNQDGEIEGMIGLIRDVSERLERKRELERYEAAVEGSTDLLVAVDRDRRVLFANEQYRDLHGQPEGYIRGSHLRKIVGEDTFEEIEPHIERALEGEEGQFTREQLTEKGETRLVDVSYYPLREGAEDEITGVVASLRDITESETRKQKLREFKQAVDAAGHAIYMTDSDGEITYANEAFEDVTGYPPAEAIGQNPRILKSGEMSEAYYEEVWETVTSGEIWEEEVINRRKNGDIYHARQTIAPVTNEAEDIEGYVAIQTDITEQKERQEHMRSIDRMLRHNLNSEMNVILGWASMIEEEGSGNLAEYAKSIREAGNKLLDQATKEREIVKILTEPSSATRIDLTQRIRSITERLQEEYPEAVFELDLPAELEISTIPEIERAIEELLENAIVHAAEEPSDVRVGVTETEDGIELEIVDSNPTIPSDQLAALKDTSQIDQLKHTSGMGLWLAKRIVSRANGTLMFEGREPTGNRITIALPT